MEAKILMCEPIYKGTAMQVKISGRHSDFVTFAERYGIGCFRMELTREMTTIWANELTERNARELVRMYNQEKAKQCLSV